MSNRALVRKRTMLSGIALLFILTGGLLAERKADDTVLNQEFDGCTSIIVGKAASVDGSTMTSHSCDSNTDRTWINLVPHKKHPAGSMCKLYFQTKRTKGPDDPDMLDVGEIPQVPETYVYINTAYAVMKNASWRSVKPLSAAAGS